MVRLIIGTASWRALAWRVGLLAGALACVTVLPAAAQDRYAVERCQDEIRFRIQRDRDSPVQVNFRRAEDNFISNAETGVRGRGVADGRAFTYECRVNVRYRGLSDASYNYTGGGVGGGGVGGGGATVPSWLTGYFYGRDPESRRQVTLSIDSSGYVSAAYDNGDREEGYFDGDAIRFGRAQTWQVEQTDNGFRARSNQRVERFSRTSDNTGGTWRVPRWAVGTFRGTTDSGESELRIGPDGSATARSLRTNQTFTGSYANGVLRFEWGAFNLLRDGDGIRTIEIRNRDNQTTYRRVGGY
ncbi:MAG TPA: hypothetical protein VF546_11355 [Pyrinomonadaceae bacterium]|jgi:hypothetical protein